MRISFRLSVFCTNVDKKKTGQAITFMETVCPVYMGIYGGTFFSEAA